jgi:hypothetical protein
VRGRRASEELGGANIVETGEMLAGSTGLEPAASGVTGASPESGSFAVSRFSSGIRAIAHPRAALD